MKTKRSKPKRVTYFVAAQGLNKTQSFHITCDADKPIEEVWNVATKHLNDQRMVFVAFNRI